MSYAIASVYYGTYLEEDTEAWWFELEGEHTDEDGNSFAAYTLGEAIIDNEDAFSVVAPDPEEPNAQLIGLVAEKFEKLYTDGGPRVFVLGQELGCFDETEGNYSLDSFIDRLSGMRRSIDHVRAREVLETHSLLPEGLRDAMPPIGIYVIWSRS